VEERYDAWEALSPEAWARWAAARVEETVRRAWEATPAGRAAVEAAGGLAGRRWPEDLARLPLLRKEALPALQADRPPFGGWTAVPLAALRRVFVSPGPIYDPQPHGPDAWGFARALHAAGFRRGDVVLNTFAYHLTPAGHMVDEGLEALGCVVVPGGGGQSELQAQVAARLGARGYVGTPSFLATLLAQRHRPPFRVALVSGEVLADGLRRELGGQGVRVSQAYATADVGLIAYECEAARGLHLSPRVYVEVVDPHTGTPLPAGSAGEVVVTFLSETYPLLRLATGDLSVLEPAPCPCGRGSPRLRGVLGRVGEAVKVRGMFVHPNDVRRALEHLPEVARLQLRVTREGHQDRLTARVEPAGAVVDPGRVAAVLREAVRLRVEVEVLPPRSLPADAPLVADERRWE
jgi:phenylacetate-CoA ligase